MRPILLALALTLAGCSSLNLSLPPAATVSEAPSITGVDTTPTETTAASDAFTFKARATDPKGARLTYKWSATRGTLASEGAGATWKPLRKDGKPEPAGLAQVTVEVSNGKAVASYSVNFRIHADGSALIVQPGSIPIVYQSTPPAGPVSGTAPEATATPAPGASPSSALCRIGSTVPSLSSPGSVFYVTGDGLGADAKVKLGTRDAAVVSADPKRLVVRIPEGMPITNDELTVSVSACGQTQNAQGTLRLGDLPSFAAGSTDAAPGLLVSLLLLENGTTRLPDNLGVRRASQTFLAATIDVAPTPFSKPFPGAQGDVMDYYALRYDANLSVPTAGRVGFSLLAKDGAKLFIDNKLVVNNDLGQRGAETAAGSADLSAGRHAFRLEYFQGPRGSAALQLYWSLPGKGEVIVPASAFSLPEGL